MLHAWKLSDTVVLDMSPIPRENDKLFDTLIQCHHYTVDCYCTTTWRVDGHVMVSENGNVTSWPTNTHGNQHNHHLGSLRMQSSREVLDNKTRARRGYKTWSDYTLPF